MASHLASAPSQKKPKFKALCWHIHIIRSHKQNNVTAAHRLAASSTGIFLSTFQCKFDRGPKPFTTVMHSSPFLLFQLHTKAGQTHTTGFRKQIPFIARETYETVSLAQNHREHCTPRTRTLHTSAAKPPGLRGLPSPTLPTPRPPADSARTSQRKVCRLRPPLARIS